MADLEPEQGHARVPILPWVDGDPQRVLPFPDSPYQCGGVAAEVAVSSGELFQQSVELLLRFRILPSPAMDPVALVGSGVERLEGGTFPPAFSQLFGGPRRQRGFPGSPSLLCSLGQRGRVRRVGGKGVGGGNFQGSSVLTAPDEEQGLVFLVIFRRGRLPVPAVFLGLGVELPKPLFQVLLLWPKSRGHDDPDSLVEGVLQLGLGRVVGPAE